MQRGQVGRGHVGVDRLLRGPLLGHVEAALVVEVAGEHVALAALLGAGGLHAGGDGGDGVVALGGVEVDGAGDEDASWPDFLAESPRPSRRAPATMTPMPAQLTPTDRTKVRRLPDRGTYDRDLIDAVIDEAYIAHVGLRGRRRAPRAADDLRARRRPPLPPRRGRQRHAARARPSAEVCVTITLLDGLVLARSAFHHSMNYRSVVLLGQPTKVEDEAAKRHAFDVIVEHVLPGRSAVARPTNDSELRKHARPRPRDRRGLGQGPHRRPDRRRGGHGPARVGRRRAAPPRPRRPRSRTPPRPSPASPSRSPSRPLTPSALRSGFF